MPYETKKTVFTKAKQTIGNRLAGRAAKGAIPVDRTTKIGCPNGRPIFVYYESSMGIDGGENRGASVLPSSTALREKNKASQTNRGRGS